MLWIALTAKTQSVLWIVPLWNLTTERDSRNQWDSRNLTQNRRDIIQPNMHTERFRCSDWLKKISYKKGKKKNWNSTPRAVRETRTALSMGLTCVLNRKLSTAVPGSAMGEVSFHGMAGIWDNKPVSKTGFAQSLLRMGISISPSETHPMLTEVDHNQLPTSCDEALTLSHRSFPALTHPAALQQDWEHWFAQLSASRPKQMTETDHSECVWRITMRVWQ